MGGELHEEGRVFEGIKSYGRGTPRATEIIPGSGKLFVELVDLSGTATGYEPTIEEMMTGLRSAGYDADEEIDDVYCNTGAFHQENAQMGYDELMFGRPIDMDVAGERFASIFRIFKPKNVILSHLYAEAVRLKNVDVQGENNG